LANKCKIVCDYHKERRPFTAKDAARVICYARQGGARWSTIKEEASKKCGPLDDLDCDCERLANTIRLAETALALAVAILAVVVTRGRALKKVQPIFKKAIERGITIEGEVIRDVKALDNAIDKAKFSQETLQKSINELSLAQREAFAMRNVIIKP